MNFGLAKEIYGGGAWCVDPMSFISLSKILKNIQNGVSLDLPEKRYNSVSLLVKNNTKLIEREWQLDNSESFEGIGIINLNGPITKGGGASSSGMVELSNTMLKMAQDIRIKGFVVPTDSGGGASGAVDIMADTINEVKKTKPVYAVVTKGGMAGSAAYGIISAATKIFSEDEMSIVGSVGTMISFDAHAANTESPDGVKHITVYATKSTKKNKAFEEAVNNDNYELLVSELLDPINEKFISKTLSNRPQLKGTNFDDGHTVFSKDAVGTFIDGIASFDQVVNMVIADSKMKPSIKNNTNINSKKMTKEEIKSTYPDAYSQILSEGVAKGVTQESERVKSWNAYAKADPEAVRNGIDSGLDIAPSQREAFLIKLHSVSMLDNLKSDSAKDLATAESTVDKKVEPTENEKEIASAMDFDLKTK